ncbi:uncharacterized protein LOC132717449 [Ruditapes philippinarum]|uniref:uncharacterized protein LOC132717449 n=1 Tax=Ruditapes philippinarum TaxID=129788 RepID=UPI00295C2566|nr:uncharacterized protein LOC132717449 [Ruditapes philippinarum]
MALPQTGTKPLTFIPSLTRRETDDIECDTCRLKDVTQEARTYCINCKKYMCFDCKLDHQNADSSKAHIIVQDSDMPKERLPNAKVSVQSCDKHVYKMVEFYCPHHVTAFCNECKESKHFRCHGVNDIKSLAKGIKSGRDLPRTIQEVRKMVLQFEKLKTYKEAQDDRMEEQLVACLKDIHDLRVQVNTAFDALERKIRADIETKTKKVVNEIRNVRNECTKRIAILQEESTELEAIKGSDETQCFLSMVHAQSVKSECDDILNKLMKENNERHLEFEPNHKLVHFLKTFDSFGSIKTTLAKPSNASKVFTPTPLPSMDLPSNMLSTLKGGKDLVPCGEFNIHAPEDTKISCSITGATFLADGKLLLVDNRNHNVKLFDQAIQLKSNVALSSPPCDIAALNNREAVVSLPEKKQLDFLIMDPDLRLTRAVKTETACHGICVLEKGLLVTCYSHGVYGLVLLLDIEGRVKQRFDRDVNGDALFQGPFFIAPNPKRDRFYVSDKAANKVLGVTTAGKILFRYHSKDLEAPGYITVDKEGALFVCGRDSKNIHMVNSHGRKIKIFSADDEMEGSAICYRASDGLFVLCSHNSDRIRTYKLL